jgi:hypothetical protein
MPFFCSPDGRGGCALHKKNETSTSAILNIYTVYTAVKSAEENFNLYSCHIESVPPAKCGTFTYKF